MKRVFLILCILFGLVGLQNVSAQAKSTPNPDAPLMFDMYQIYLDIDFQSIIKIEYEKEEKSLKGRLSVERDIIILDNYDGKSRVKVTYKAKNGEVSSFSKSRCVIDPYVPL